MKILVLYHTLWIEMMTQIWQQINSMEITDLPIPIVDWEQKPDLKKKVVKLICDMAELKKIDLIVDINGAGIQPLDEEFRNWTVTSSETRWCEWWWDDPVTSVPASKPDGYKKAWLDCAKSPMMTHFFWDATLAKEYSVWFGKKCHYLPTAVHPGAFAPENASLSKRKFPETDFSFLGTYYKNNPPSDETGELDIITRTRLADPALSYFDIANGPDKARMPQFNRILENAVKGDGFFDDSLRQWRHRANCAVGYERRNTKIDGIAGSGASCYFCGFNFPPGLHADPKPIYQPTELSALYLTSMLNLNFNSGQSFSGLPMRCYEIMSCGGLLATPERPDFDQNANLESNIYFRYSSTNELLEILKMCKTDKARTQAMRQNAREYAAVNHSWLQRLPVILSHCFSS